MFLSQPWMRLATFLGLMEALLFLVPTPLKARLGNVETREGLRYSGHIRLDKNTVVVINTNQGYILPIQLTNVLSLFLKDELPIGLGIGANDVSSNAASPTLPDGWRSQAIGAGATQGSAECKLGVFQVHSTGTGVRLLSDSFYFVYRPVNGNSEIVARLVQLPRYDSTAQAGIMMRESLAPDAPNVFLAATPAQSGLLQWREKPETDTVIQPQRAMNSPGWMRLKRVDDVITGYISRNGRNWRTAGEIHLPMEQEIYAGIGVAAGYRGRPVHCTFDQVREAPSLPMSAFQPQVSLMSGSVVACRIHSADDFEIHFFSQLNQPPIRLRQVASMVFQWLPNRYAANVNNGRRGVLLTSGEFVDGEFVGIENFRVKISSVLLGHRTYDINSEVLAVVLRAARPTLQPYLVKTVKGSTLLCSDLAFHWNEISLNEPVTGTWRLPLTELKGIQRVE